MREISTKEIEIGEHVMIDGVEYVAKEHSRSCDGCAFEGSNCELIACGDCIMVKVEKQDKDTPMTNHELAEWLAKGNGQYKFRYGYTECSFWIVEKSEEDLPVGDILIRPWGTDEWIKPTLEIYERDCR